MRIVKYCLGQILFTLSFLFASNLLWAQASNFPEKDGITFSPRWVDNLIFLNHMGDGIAPDKQMLYKWAEAKLAIQPSKGFEFLAENRHFQEYCETKGITHLGGPMLGNISQHSVDIWVRTVKPDSFSVKVKIDGEYRTFGPVVTTLDSDLSGVIHIDGLESNSTYPYQVFVNERKIVIPEQAKIRTSPEPEEENTIISFGSCFHRWGLGNLKQTGTLLKRKPLAFIGLGDIVAQDKLNAVGWHSLDYLSRDLYPAWQNLVANVPFYALWDDHDYFGNDLSGTPKGYIDQDKENVWSVFRHSWNNPGYGFGEEGKGVFFRTRIGAADVITIDHRFFRTDESFLGKEQMAWLEQQLLDCEGPFIILATGTMWSDHVSGGKDSWGVSDPAAREYIFELIEKNNIKGVLLISGDRHGSRGFRIPRPSGFNFYEFEVASLGGLAGPPATKAEWSDQLFGISGGYAFGEFAINSKLKDPTVTFRLIGENEKIIYQLKLSRSELTPANYR